MLYLSQMKKPKIVKKVVKAKAQKPKRVKKPRIVKTDAPYRISITMSGETYTADAETLTEALLTFNPSKIVGKILFVVEKGGKRFERLIFAQQGRRIFGNALAAQYFAKGISMVIDN